MTDFELEVLEDIHTWADHNLDIEWYSLETGWVDQKTMDADVKTMIDEYWKDYLVA
tara:strand:+ start:919 stop:1086 length:168 start_codon:yes stop_codon:yes gene_type:complete